MREEQENKKLQEKIAILLNEIDGYQEIEARIAKVLGLKTDMKKDIDLLLIDYAKASLLLELTTRAGNTLAAAESVDWESYYQALADAASLQTLHKTTRAALVAELSRGHVVGALAEFGIVAREDLTARIEREIERLRDEK
jgi:hypothetical protein